MASPYITEQKMLHYRTLTTLLAQTEVIEETRDGQRTKYLDLAKVPEPRDKARCSAFSHFTALLVRGDEVVAVLPSAERAKAVDVAIIHQPHERAVTRNLRSDEATGSEAKLSSLPKVKACFIDTPHELLKVEDNFGAAFFRYGRNVPFDVHCKLVLKLLKLNRESPTNKMRRRTAGNLAAWTMLASNLKMIKRLNSGIHNKNVWHYLAEMSDETLSEKAPTANDVKIKQLSARAPSEEQASFLRIHQTKGHVNQDWTEQKPLFDKSGRRMIWALLRQLLNPVKGSLEELREFLTDENTVSALDLGDTNPKFCERLQKCGILTNKAFKDLKELSRFIELFKPEILLTCKWIAKVFDLRRTTLNIATSQTGKQSPASFPFVSSSLAQASSSSPTKAAESESDAPEKPIEDQYQVSSEKTTEADIEASAELNDLHIISKKGWGEVVLRWIEVLCLHVQALQSLTILKAPDASQQRISQYVNKVTLKVVDVQPEVKDIRMQGFDEFMDDFEMGVADRDAIKRWLIGLPTMGQRAWNRARFTGTWHCEAILLSLHALAVSALRGSTEDLYWLIFEQQKYDLSSASQTPLEQVSQSVKPPAVVSSELIDYLKVVIQSLSGCNTIVGDFYGTGPPVVYPGSHVQWSAVALPPWLLEKTAKTLIKIAEVALFTRFEKIWNLLKNDANVRKRSLSAASHVPPEEPYPKRLRQDLPDIEEEAIADEEGSQMQGLRLEEEGGGVAGGNSDLEL
ncbi:MAG: hypothetical protein Q9219_006164 [cf. Caloplaca sp. 3 TL-2023]